MAVCMQFMQCIDETSLGLLNMSSKGEITISIIGFRNMKKAFEKLKVHEGSNFHREAIGKTSTHGQKTVIMQLDAHYLEQKRKNRAGLPNQESLIRVLARKGLLFRGHEDEEWYLFPPAISSVKSIVSPRA